MLTKETKKIRDKEINGVIDKFKFDSKKKPKIAKKNTTVRKSLSIFFIVILVLSGLVFGLFHSAFQLNKYTPYYKSTYVVIGLFILLFMFNYATFVTIKDFDTVNMTRLLKMTGYTMPIVVITYIVLRFVPRMIDVFANTIGYSIISIPYLFNLTKVMSNFKSKLFVNTGEYNVPFTWLITTLNSDKFDDVVGTATVPGQIPRTNRPSNYDFYLNPPDYSTFISDLKNLVETKEQIGHCVWLYFAIMTAVLISTHELIK